MPKILVVDDERSTLWLIEHYLSDAGFETVSTSKGTEAANLLRDPRNRFHLLLTDVFMPVVSGYDLAKVALENNPELPVLFVSGFSFDPLTPAGANSAFLPKPFSRLTLLQAVSALLDPPTPVLRAAALAK